MKILEYHLDDFSRDIKTLANNIKLGTKKYDSIIALTRGGIVPAGWISQYLGVRKVGTVGGYFNNNDEFVYKTILNGDIYGKTLLVSDLCKSGLIINKVKEDIAVNTEIECVDVACIHFFPKSSSIKPDYYVNSIQEDLYVVYPWEI